MTEEKDNSSIPLPNDEPRNPVSLENIPSEGSSYKDLLEVQKTADAKIEKSNPMFNFAGMKYDSDTNKVKSVPIAQRLFAKPENFVQSEPVTKPDTNLKNDVIFPVKETVSEPKKEESNTGSNKQTVTPVRETSSPKTSKQNKESISQKRERIRAEKEIALDAKYIEENKKNWGREGDRLLSPTRETDTSSLTGKNNDTVSPIKETDTSSLTGKNNDTVSPIKETDTSSLVAKNNDTVSPMKETDTSSLVAKNNDTVSPIKETDTSSLTGKNNDTVSPTRETDTSSLVAKKSDTVSPMKETDAGSLVAKKSDTVSPMKETDAGSLTNPSQVKPTPSMSNLQTPQSNPYKETAIAVSAKMALENEYSSERNQQMPMPSQGGGFTPARESGGSSMNINKPRNDTVLQVSLTRMSYPIWMLQGLVG